MNGATPAMLKLAAEALRQYEELLSNETCCEMEIEATPENIAFYVPLESAAWGEPREATIEGDKLQVSGDTLVGGLAGILEEAAEEGGVAA